MPSNYYKYAGVIALYLITPFFIQVLLMTVDEGLGLHYYYLSWFSMVSQDFQDAVKVGCTHWRLIRVLDGIRPLIFIYILWRMCRNER